jgi:two-component system cell cycle response regulator
VSDVKTAIAIPSARLDPEAHGTPCLVVFYGRQLGRRHLLDRPEVVVGRSDSAVIQVDEDWVSREHARIAVREHVCTLEDLGSTNGTWVNDARITTTELCDGDLVRVGQTVFKYLSGRNIEAKYHEAMYRLTITDGLTGAVNKLAFLDALEREITRARHDGVHLSLAMFDIDFFKNVNDTWGHLAGDAVLRELSRLAAGQVRPVDTLARYGGEEFALILPGASLESAREACEAIRLLVGQAAFSFDDHPLPITISCGVATLDFRDMSGSATVSPATFIARADERLYDAKQHGRNRVSC